VFEIQKVLNFSGFWLMSKREGVTWCTQAVLPGYAREVPGGSPVYSFSVVFKFRVK